jgi:hypothetical protein
MAVDAKTDGEAPATWVRVALFGDAVAAPAPTLTKGTQVYCEGRLSLGTWKGRARSGLNLAAWEVQPMGQIGRRKPKARARDEQVAVQFDDELRLRDGQPGRYCLASKGLHPWVISTTFRRAAWRSGTVAFSLRKQPSGYYSPGDDLFTPFSGPSLKHCSLLRKARGTAHSSFLQLHLEPPPQLIEHVLTGDGLRPAETIHLLDAAQCPLRVSARVRAKVFHEVRNAPPQCPAKNRTCQSLVEADIVRPCM